MNSARPQVTFTPYSPSGLGAFAKLRKAAMSFVVCLSKWNNSAPNGRIFVEFYIRVFLENMSRKFRFHLNLTRIKWTLREDQYIFLIISRYILLRMRNVSDASCRENQNTHFIFGDIFFRESCRLLDNVEKIC